MYLFDLNDFIKLSDSHVLISLDKRKEVKIHLASQVCGHLMLGEGQVVESSQERPGGKLSAPSKVLTKGCNESRAAVRLQGNFTVAYPFLYTKDFSVTLSKPFRKMSVLLK